LLQFKVPLGNCIAF